MRYKINQQSIDFLFDHSFLTKRFFNNLFELQYELDELYLFILSNVSTNQYDNEETYDSMMFAVVEHHIMNCIVPVT